MVFLGGSKHLMGLAYVEVGIVQCSFFLELSKSDRVEPSTALHVR